jgi:hypothetical protein
MGEQLPCGTRKEGIDIMVSLLSERSKWPILWGILSLILALLGLLSYVYVNLFAIIIFELFPPAYFALWAMDSDHFLKNGKKLIILLILLSGLIPLFGMHFVWISIFIMLVAIRLLKYTKQSILWSFGSFLLYGTLGLIPLGIIFAFGGIDLQLAHSSPFTILTKWGLLLIIGYALKGALFGGAMYFAKKEYHENKRLYS